VVATDPTHPIGWAYLGATLSDLKREDESIPPLLEAVRLDPNRTEPKLMLARALVLAGRAAEAVPYFQAAGAKSEEVWPTTIADGRARLALWDLATARDRFRHARQAAPDMAEPWFLLGVCDDLSGHTPEAVANLREAARLRSAPGRARLAVLLSRLGEHTEAVAIARQAVQSAPKDPSAHAALGWVCLQSGHESEARSAFAEAARLAPNWPADTAREAMAILDSPIWRTGAAAARDAARQAWEVSDRQNPAAAATLAAAEAALGHFEEAVRLAEQAADLAQKAGRPTTAEEYRRQADRYRRGLPHRD
jgi:Flp pilus assembly protein TadD